MRHRRARSVEREAGRTVAKITGRNLKKVVLELGGSDLFTPFSTDDLDAAAKVAVVLRKALGARISLPREKVTDSTLSLKKHLAGVS